MEYKPKQLGRLCGEQPGFPCTTERWNRTERLAHRLKHQEFEPMCLLDVDIRGFAHRPDSCLATPRCREGKAFWVD
jgi:hypothetical protein